MFYVVICKSCLEFLYSFNDTWGCGVFVVRSLVYGALGALQGWPDFPSASPAVCTADFTESSRGVEGVQPLCIAL